MKISIITNISALEFYKYIGEYRRIFWHKILINQKLIKTYENIRKILKNEIKSIIYILKLFYWRNWYMYDMICNIKFNYIVSIDKKCEFYICTFIMKLNYYKYTNYVIQIYYYIKLIKLLQIY